MRNSRDTASTRCKNLPDAFYILIAHNADKNTSSTHDILAPRPFTLNDITSTQIRSHLSSQSILSHTSPFLSTHPYPSQALACLPLDRNPGKHPSTIDVVKIDASKIRPAWTVMHEGDKVPIWVEQDTSGQSPGGKAFEPSYWICVDEVTDVFDLEHGMGSGEWLACGRVPARMICTTDVVKEVDLDVWMEIAKRPSVIANKKAHTIALDMVPERKGSLVAGSAVEKGKRRKTKEVVNALPTEEVEQRERAQPARTVPMVPTRPAPPIPSRPRHLLVIPEDLHDNESLELTSAREDLPVTISTPMPKFIIRPPTPAQPPLSHTVIDMTSLASCKRAATLAMLSEMKSNSAALKIVVEQSRVKHEASMSTSRQNRDRTDLRRDVWARNYDE